MKEQVQDLEEINSVLTNAELIHDAVAVENAIKKMADEINAQLTDKNPLILSVMIGGIIPTGMLLPYLNFSLQVDYIHVTRYCGETTGSNLHWLKKPEKSLAGKTILLVDDILDEGITLSEIIGYCKQSGADEIYTAVLAEKELPHDKVLEKADFTGLWVPDRYVFGYGMDYHDYHRNCAGIYALKEE